jgi:hypothetical protein
VATSIRGRLDVAATLDVGFAQYGHVSVTAPLLSVHVQLLPLSNGWNGWTHAHVGPLEEQANGVIAQL